MTFMRCKKQEEGLVIRTILLNEFFTLFDPGVCEIFIPKSGCVPTGVKTNSTDAVVNRLIVAVRPVHFERIACRYARREIR